MENPFTPIKTIELSSGTAEVYQDGSMLLKQLWAEEEHTIPLSKNDVDKIVTQYLKIYNWS